MSIKQKLEKNPRALSAITAGLVIVAMFVTTWQFISGPSYSVNHVKSYYVTEDSSSEGALATLFKDDVGRITPFDKDGRSAVRAYIFTTDEDRTRIVGYLERYTPQGRKLLEDYREGKIPHATQDAIDRQLEQRGIEIKKPGDSQWVLLSDRAQASRVLAILPPGDARESKIKSVFP